MLNHFEFPLGDTDESVTDLSTLCIHLLRYGMISDYVFSSIHDVLGQLYGKEIKKLIKAMKLASSDALGNDFFPSDLMNYVEDQKQFVIDYRNIIVHIINSDKFITDDEQLEEAVSAVKSMR